MVQQIIYTDEMENLKVEKLSKHWHISKADTIKKMIRDFEEQNE